MTEIKPLSKDHLLSKHVSKMLKELCLPEHKQSTEPQSPEPCSTEHRHSQEQLLCPAKRGQPIDNYYSVIARDLSACYMRCCTCGYCHFESSLLRNGPVTAMEKKTFKCNVCSHTFSNNRNKKRHEKEEHGTTICYFVCLESGCTSTFLRRGYLTTHLKNRHGLSPAVAQAKSAGAVERYCLADDYRRRGKQKEVSPTLRKEPTSKEPISSQQPCAMVIDDLVSLHPGDDECLSLPDETHSGNIRATEDNFSDISIVDFPRYTHKHFPIRPPRRRNANQQMLHLRTVYHLNQHRAHHRSHRKLLDRRRVVEVIDPNPAHCLRFLSRA